MYYSSYKPPVLNASCNAGSGNTSITVDFGWIREKLSLAYDCLHITIGNNNSPLGKAHRLV
jgi:hypothetical protein